MWFSWPFRSLAVLCAVAVAIGGLHLVQPTPSERVEQGAAAVSAAQKFADAATAAFTESAVGSDLTVSPEQRRTGLPTDPVTGLTSQTAAGPVQIVLPGGLGRAEHTPGGQVVYPNAGAGFDLLAENTATGTRTVARIAGPGGPRMVTTFVRTPADTVMLAHTNGYLTINKATPTAETVGMFAPAETRDATGGPVPSSYLVKQLAPQLYVLAEVIDPRPDTAWPVYVDPPLHLTGAGARRWVCWIRSPTPSAHWPTLRRRRSRPPRRRPCRGRRRSGRSSKRTRWNRRCWSAGWPWLSPASVDLRARPRSLRRR